MTEQEAKSALVDLIHDSAAHVEADWSEALAADTVECDFEGRAGAKYSYAYGAPQPNQDNLAAVQTIADFWRDQGLEVKVDEERGPVVYGSGGPVQNVSFSSAPGDYLISGTGLCFPVDTE